MKINVMKLIVFVSVVAIMVPPVLGNLVCDYRDPQTCIEYGDVEDPSYVYLVGNYHLDTPPISMEKLLLDKAVDEEFVYAQESMVFDEETELNAIKALGHADRGFVRGMEDPFANMLCTITYFFEELYGYDKYPDLYEGGVAEAISAFLEMIKTNSFSKNIWNNFYFHEYQTNSFLKVDNSPEEKIVKYLAKFFHDESIFYMDALRHILNSRQLSDCKKWIALYRKFGHFIVDNELPFLKKRGLMVKESRNI